MHNFNKYFRYQYRKVTLICTVVHAHYEPHHLYTAAPALFDEKLLSRTGECYRTVLCIENYKNA